MNAENLGDRMKGYEKVFDRELPPRQPVIVRLDGNSFHEFTASRFEFPFDAKFKNCMNEAAIATMKYCNGSMIAYVQSDEISVLLRNDLNPDMGQFLNGRIQKICSLVASACAVRFSKEVSKLTGKDEEVQFDCRCFVMPANDVVNYYEWRQQDTIKNAINSIIYWKLRGEMGAKAAQRKLDGIPTDSKQEILEREYGIKIDDYPSYYIRGSCIYKVEKTMPIEEVAPPEIIDKYNKHGEMVTRHEWKIDKEIPIFHECREFIDRFLA